MLPRPRTKFSLMPAISLIALSLMAALPSLAGMHAYAAAPERFSTVTVRQGDTLWGLAATRTPAGGNVTEMIDRIVAVNNLHGGSLSRGQRLRIPQ